MTHNDNFPPLNDEERARIHLAARILEHHVPGKTVLDFGFLATVHTCPADEISRPAFFAGARHAINSFLTAAQLDETDNGTRASAILQAMVEEIHELKTVPAMEGKDDE